MDLEFVDSVTRASSKSTDSMRRANARRTVADMGQGLFRLLRSSQRGILLFRGPYHVYSPDRSSANSAA